MLWGQINLTSCSSVTCLKLIQASTQGSTEMWTSSSYRKEKHYPPSLSNLRNMYFYAVIFFQCNSDVFYSISLTALWWMRYSCSPQYFCWFPGFIFDSIFFLQRYQQAYFSLIECSLLESWVSNVSFYFISFLNIALQIVHLWLENYISAFYSWISELEMLHLIEHNIETIILYISVFIFHIFQSYSNSFDVGVLHLGIYLFKLYPYIHSDKSRKFC